MQRPWVPSSARKKCVCGGEVPRAFQYGEKKSSSFSGNLYKRVTEMFKTKGKSCYVLF